MKDDFVDELFEYDQVMNDGKMFFPDEKKKAPKGGGCLTAIISVIVIITMLSLMVLLMVACGSQGPTLYGPYDVVKVVDGDTVRVMIDGKETKIRIIGINTPESVHSDESKNTLEGKTASERLSELIQDSQVYLEFDEEQYDKYDRMLAYVYMSDGETMVERVLLEEGMATTMTVEPNTKYKEEFAEIQREAKADKAGFWGTGFFK